MSEHFYHPRDPDVMKKYDGRCCPTCGGDDLLEKTPGWLGRPEDNPAGAKCMTCRWSGTTGQAVLAGIEKAAMKEKKG